MNSGDSGSLTCEPCITHWAEENIDDLRVSAEAESERLQEILQQIQSIQTLPPNEKRKKLEQLVEILQHSASKEELQQLLDSLDIAVTEFMGDPRRFVACIAQILTCLENDASKTQMSIQRYLRDKQIGQISTPAPFDWTMVDILLSQLCHLAGEDAIFSREMRDSIVFSLFPASCEGHYLQDLVSHFLLLSVGEKIPVVRKRMRSLSQAPLSKVTLLSNMVIEINEKYEKEIEEIRTSIMDLTRDDDALFRND
ncbi:hypothetical protein TRFO_23192 [Tritrichomonas foetus]|uniref:Uncharacterized protein n=1 Tax=Tritrichomonas foetus TaxID=1144522 RepID=A0A1J4KAA7_9EUKA|nr:hypothetical protein TRFO_23192 [Tritrichomonas foetus]|eukprot:OHT08359.1 hypothetical protein TRFO_23192 [Tritrichomonas foetus]